MGHSGEFSFLDKKMPQMIQPNMPTICACNKLQNATNQRSLPLLVTEL